MDTRGHVKLGRRAAWAGVLALACALPAAAAPDAAGPVAEVRSSFILDPGHGGDDLGAVVGGKMEKDITLSIARKVKDHLERLGTAPVRLTRDSDAYLPLDRRVEQSLALRGEVFVSLHVNKVRYKQLQGLTVYNYGRHLFSSLRRPFRHHRRPPPLPAPPKKNIRESAVLAASVARSLRAQGFKIGAPETADYYVLKNPRIPSILIEMGYLSNPEEAARLSDPAYQDTLAFAIAESLRSYYAKTAPKAQAGALARKI